MNLALLGALFLQCAAIAYLYNRNELFDRKNLIFIGPFVVILLISYLLSLTNLQHRNGSLGFQDSSIHSCSFTNRFLSFCLASMFLFLPYWFNQVTRFECKVHDTAISWKDGKSKLSVWEQAMGLTPKNLWNSIKLFSLGTTVSYYACLFTLLYCYIVSSRTLINTACLPNQSCLFDQDLNDGKGLEANEIDLTIVIKEPYFAVCTTKGHNGYQIWPFLIWSNTYVKYILIGTYFAMSNTYQYLPRPTLFTQTLAGCVLSVPLLLYSKLDEWGNFWIYWVVPLLLIQFYIEPKVIQWTKILDSNMLKRNEDAAKKRGDAYPLNNWWTGKVTTRQLVFRLVWHRFVLWKWHPWRDKSIEEEEARLYDINSKNQLKENYDRIETKLAKMNGTFVEEKEVIQPRDLSLGNAKGQDEFDMA